MGRRVGSHVNEDPTRAHRIRIIPSRGNRGHREDLGKTSSALQGADPLEKLFVRRLGIDRGGERRDMPCEPLRQE